MAISIQQIVDAVGTSSKSVDDVAITCNVSKQVIFGCLNMLKKDQLVVYDDGMMSLTDKGINRLTPVKSVKKDVKKAVEHVATGQKGRQADPTSKRAQAEHLLATNSHLRRSEKIKLLISQVGLTQQGANTYIYNYDKKMKMK